MKYKKIAAAAVIISVLLACLVSCANENRNISETKNKTTSQQSISDLYENAGVTGKMIAHDPFNLSLSHNDYFYTEDIFVEITSDIKNAEIYYTTDGSTPSRENLNTTSKFKGSKLYSEPILLDSTDYNSPHVLKAVAYSKNSRSRVLTHTYFVSFKMEERFDYNTYVFSISSDPDNLYSYEYGIFVEGKLRDEWQKAHPGQWPNPPEPANYNLRGREGEREGYLEVFDSKGKLLVSQGAGIRVHGAWSRAADKKSMRLYARGEYDNIFDKFYYPFFEDNRRNDEYKSYINEYKSILLRNGANDRGGAFMREEFSQGLAKQAGFLDYKEFAPAAVFVNGEYFGFFWLQTFYGDDYFMDKYDVDGKNLVEIMEWEEPKAGGNLSDDEIFAEFCDIVDLDNYIKYYAFQIYGRNWDWPHNNKKLWRYAENGGTYINKYLDKKYRMLLYDAEGGWGDWAGTSEKTIQRIKNDGSSPVFTSLMKRWDMQEKFCNQMFDLLNTVFTYDNMERLLEDIADLYDYEIGIAMKKSVLPNNAQNIKNSRRDILRFAQKREIYIIEDMVKNFKLNEQTYEVRAAGDKNANIVLNTLELSGEGNLKSCYFLDHAVILSAEPHPGYLFDFWEINGKKYYDKKIELNWFIAENYAIKAKLSVKPDETYHNIEIKTLRPDADRDIIVLYNPGANETVVNDLYLSNDKDNLQKFHIKKVRFPAKSTMTYYGFDSAGNQNQKIKPSHIFDFKLKKGETVYLSDKTGKILCEVHIPENLNMHKGEQISRSDDGSYKIERIR
ncbi:MAG: CotH kinase family protein [Oscillospiraceae bacterium]|nr:CotH kinase family protein [Oscillospiraceae bacterium]